MSKLNFDSYQKEANSLKIYGKGDIIIYPALKLNGEAGEVAEKVGKVLRDKEGKFSNTDKEEIAKELGDVLWYISALADDINYSLTEIAEMNLEKLFSRHKRGKLQGSGDNR